MTEHVEGVGGGKTEATTEETEAVNRLCAEAGMEDWMVVKDMVEYAEAQGRPSSEFEEALDGYPGPQWKDRGEGVAMAQCAFKRKDGEPCQGVAIGPLLGCWAHDPTYENDRIKTTPAKRRGGQRAGRGRPAWEPLNSPGQEDLIRLQGLFEQLADDVLSGEANKANAAVAIQALNGARSCILGAAKLRELFEVEARLAALEQSLESGSSIGTIRPLE